MDPILKRRAEELAEALAASQAYQRVRSARQAVEEHAAAKVMLKDLEGRRAALEQRQAAGETLTDKEIEQFQKISEVVMMNPYVRELMQAEWEFAHALMEVQQVLAKAIGAELTGLPDGTDPEDGEDEAASVAEGGNAQAPGGTQPGPRIIVPGGTDRGRSGKLWTPR